MSEHAKEAPSDNDLIAETLKTPLRGRFEGSIEALILRRSAPKVLKCQEALSDNDLVKRREVIAVHPILIH